MARSLSEDGGEDLSSALLQPSTTDNQKEKSTCGTESTRSLNKLPLHSTKFSMHLDIWKYDILLYLLSVVATITLAVVLFLQDGKPQRDWAGGSITLNTVISILSAIIRASILVPVAATITQEKWLWFGSSRTNDTHGGRSFSDYEVYDRASRGPLGSMQLLWTMGVRNFASLSALLAIASIAVGPFSQQILGIKFQLREVTDLRRNTTASLIKRYDAAFHEHPKWPAQADAAKKTEKATEMPTLEMTAAIMTGFLSPNIPDLPSVCPTGNCTWPIQLSLAVCGGCEPFSPEPHYECGIDQSLRAIPCNVSFGDGSDEFSLEWNTEYLISRLVDTTEGVYPTVDYELRSGAYSTVYTDPLIPYLTIFQNIRVPPSEYASPNMSATGDECALWFCVQAYKTSTTQGIQSQSVEAVSENYLNLPYRPVNWLIRPEFRASNFDPSQDTYMSISDDSILSISKELNGQLGGSLYSTYGKTGIEVIKSSSNVMTALNTLNASTVTRNLAKSMTNHIRTQSPRTGVNTTLNSEGRMDGKSLPLSEAYSRSISNQTLGTAFSYEPYFHIRWGWVALPVALVLLAPICLTATICATWESDTPALGSGLLALVGVRVEQDVRSHLEGVDRYDVAEERAKGVMVKLERGAEGDGWEIKGLEKEHAV